MGTSKTNSEDSIYNIKQNINVNPEVHLTFVRFVTKKLRNGGSNSDSMISPRFISILPNGKTDTTPDLFHKSLITKCFLNKIGQILRHLTGSVTIVNHKEISTHFSHYNSI